jgi:hypothetical protein
VENKDFILKSGAKLHISDASWEKVVPLWSAVKLATLGSTLSPDAMGHLIMASNEVQKRLEDIYAFCTYENIQIIPSLFNDPKYGRALRTDYMEICEKILEFQLRSFFLKTSLSSMESKEIRTKNPEQP